MPGILPTVRLGPNTAPVPEERTVGQGKTGGAKESRLLPVVPDALGLHGVMKSVRNAPSEESACLAIELVQDSARIPLLRSLLREEVCINQITLLAAILHLGEPMKDTDLRVVVVKPNNEFPTGLQYCLLIEFGNLAQDMTTEEVPPLLSGQVEL